MIRVSHNELVTLCTKAFDGLRRQCGESDAIANMVADLEMAGLNGVSHYINALHFLEHERDRAVGVSEIENGVVRADLEGNSLLCHFRRC